MTSPFFTCRPRARELGHAARGLEGEVHQRQFQISRHLDVVAGSSELPGRHSISQDAGGHENDDKDDRQYFFIG